MSIKVKGFFKDIGGASRVTKMRRKSIENASAAPDARDPIRETADLLHPDRMQLTVTSIRQASATSLTYRLEPVGGHLPVFQCGQYLVLHLTIGESVLNRPYSISSAPFEARGEKPFVEITVRANRPYFVPDYLASHVKVGDVLEATLPFGTFYWEPLRDSREIVALAGGSGITPFYSMAKEIAFGKMQDCRLTILYGSVHMDDVVLGRELREIEDVCPNVRVVHIFSDEPEWEGETGFITGEIISRYATPDCTFMFCGPLPMYLSVGAAMEELKVPFRRFRHDVVGQPADVSTLPGYPDEKKTETYRITVVRGVREDVIDAKASEPVAVALERAGIAIETHCRGGECGACRSHLLSGEIFVSPIGDGRRRMDKEMGWFHACSAWPLSDLKIKVPIL